MLNRLQPNMSVVNFKNLGFRNNFKGSNQNIQERLMHLSLASNEDRT